MPDLCHSWMWISLRYSLAVLSQADLLHTQDGFNSGDGVLRWSGVVLDGISHFFIAVRHRLPGMSRFLFIGSQFFVSLYRVFVNRKEIF